LFVDGFTIKCHSPTPCARDLIGWRGVVQGRNVASLCLGHRLPRRRAGDELLLLWELIRPTWHIRSCCTEATQRAKEKGRGVGRPLPWHDHSPPARFQYQLICRQGRIIIGLAEGNTTVVQVQGRGEEALGHRPTSSSLPLSWRRQHGALPAQGWLL
jgi:hypothetical protein